MNPAWAAAIGVVAGSFVTGTIQIILAWMTRRAERQDRRVQERKDLYITALWEVRQLPRMFGDTLIRDDDDDDSEYDDEAFGRMLEAIDRAEFELRLLGKPEIGKKVEEYKDRFGEWVDAQTPGEMTQGFPELQTNLKALEAEIVDLMRKDMK